MKTLKNRMTPMKPSFDHLEIVDLPPDWTEAQIHEYLAKQGIKFHPREATLEDLIEGLSEEQKEAHRHEYAKWKKEHPK